VVEMWPVTEKLRSEIRLIAFEGLRWQEARESKVRNGTFWGGMGVTASAVRNRGNRASEGILHE
jgi:hypothetical protein